MGLLDRLGQISMVCTTCDSMLYYRRNRRRRPSTLQIDFDHHNSEASLVTCAEKSTCYICRIILERLRSLGHVRNQIENVPKDTQNNYLFATMKAVPSRPSTFQLDFHLQNQSSARLSESVASFLLVGEDQQTPLSPQEQEAARMLSQNRPVSGSTGDPAAFALARTWIDECVSHHHACSSAMKDFYPTRLIEVMDDSGRFDPTGAVRLVSRAPNEKRDHQPTFEGKYVTLSHCWGKKTLARLTKGTRTKFQDAIHHSELPLTFQHAIHCARELGVRWIWIDALCIVQDDDLDWLRESASMHEVYTQSYCNLSATASEDSSQGMFRVRPLDRDWAQGVTIRTNDTLEEAKDLRCVVLDASFWDRYVAQAPANRRSWILQERLLSPRVLHWCQDQIAFECQEMDRAECRPPGIPHLLMMGNKLIEQSKLKKIDRHAGMELRKIRLKHENSSSSSSKLQQMMDDLKPINSYYEIWKRVVELYTTLELTKSKDRLIALSGIARMLHGHMSSDDAKTDYVAGLWQQEIESQLLWRVNEVSETDGREPQPFVDLRPKTETGEHLYRAPTFSWASIETTRGVTMAETGKGESLISVEVIRLIYKNKADYFGILEDGYLLLKGVLRRVVLIDRLQEQRLQGSSPLPRRLKIYAVCFRMSQFVLLSILVLFVYWRNFFFYPLFVLSAWLVLAVATLILTIRSGMPLKRELTQEEFYRLNRWSWRLMQGGKPDYTKPEYNVVYLDSPASEPSIFGPEAQVFVIPALQTDQELICLMVQATDGDYGIRYKRIGLTSISMWHRDQLRDIKTAPGENRSTGGRYMWGPDGEKPNRSTICII